jgi:hypothetical protein
MTELGVGFFFLLWMLVVVGGMALWIVALVQVTRLPEHAFRIVGREKTNWILVVALTQVVGALIWWFGARDEVKAAAAANPLPPPYAVGPPPGWYPDPRGGAGSAWWDGTRWTDHHQ